MITAEIDMTGFNAGIVAMMRSVGATSRQIVEKETGELIKTLVKLSPPKDPARSKFKAETDVRGRMAMASNGGYRGFDETSGSVGASGIKWYAVDEKFLRGVLPENDMRKESDDKVFKAFRTYNKKGRMNLAFKHPRERQRILISQKLLATQQQINSIVKRVKKSFGRLKAAWMVSAVFGPIKLSAGNRPPKWVSDHVSLKSKGRFESGLSTPENPSFTIANFAKGIGHKAINSIVASAVSIRAKAMLKNAELYTSGKKNLADYAR
jgi:hypothetical protein